MVNLWAVDNKFRTVINLPTQVPQELFGDVNKLKYDAGKLEDEKVGTSVCMDTKLQAIKLHSQPRIAALSMIFYFRSKLE